MIATTQTWTVSFCFMSSTRCLHEFHGFLIVFFLAFAIFLIFCCFDVCRFVLFCCFVQILEFISWVFFNGTCVCMIATLN